MRNATKWSVAPRQSRTAHDRDGATVRVSLHEGGNPYLLECSETGPI
jgi:hypothetical protein